jgi:hypothetical protein
MWLPFFGLCAALAILVNYFRLGVSWSQRFIKRGRDHPLDAMGLIAAIVDAIKHLFPRLF